MKIQLDLEDLEKINLKNMSKEFILKKLDQLLKLLNELDELLSLSFLEFKKKFTNIRSAERNFQLIVELASDINAHIASELGEEIPDSYRNSFLKLSKLEILPEELVKNLIKSSNLRNILVHEYDFDEDNFIFYKSAKIFSPHYRDYIKIIQKYIIKHG